MFEVAGPWLIAVEDDSGNLPRKSGDYDAATLKRNGKSSAGTPQRIFPPQSHTRKKPRRARRSQRPAESAPRPPTPPRTSALSASSAVQSQTSNNTSLTTFPDSRPHATRRPPLKGAPWEKTTECAEDGGRRGPRSLRHTRHLCEPQRSLSPPRFKPERHSADRISKGHKKSRPDRAALIVGGNNLATTYSRRTLRPTTIGAVAFHGRVRDGNGWDHHAKVTRSRPGMSRAGRGDLRESGCFFFGRGTRGTRGTE